MNRSLALFFLLLLLLPLAAGTTQGLALFDAFYRAGALVFGGGHVVLPLPARWCTQAVDWSAMASC